VLFRTGDFLPSLEDVPTWFSDYFDIPLEAAQVILSVIVILLVLLPVLILTQGKSLTTVAVMFVLTEAVLVGISWLPGWLMILTVCIVALALAKFGSDSIGG
jgi:hypothetical protein